MAIEFTDFTAVEAHPGYLTRDLGDNGIENGGRWVELVREDGWGLGAMRVENVRETIAADQAPPTGGTLGAIFGIVAYDPAHADDKDATDIRT